MEGIKGQVIHLIQELPDNVSIDDIMAELHFKLHVDSGLKELDGGKGISHKDIERRMDKWLSKCC